MNFIDLNKQQLVEKLNRMKVSNLSKEDIIKSFSRQELELIKSEFKNLEDVIEKSHKAATIGEIREWSGKKYKKQPNGKWLEISESQGMTKKQHNYQANYSKEMSEKPSLHTSKYEDAEKWHKTEASKLSDKEHSDEEVGLGEKSEIIESPFYSYEDSKKKWWDDIASQSIKDDYSKVFIEDKDRARLYAQVLYYVNLLRKNPKGYNEKRWLNEARRDLEKYDRNKEKKELNISEAKKIFKNHNLNSTTYRSTSIRGYSIPSSNSYEISSYDPSLITFTGITEDKFNSIVKELEEKGFALSSKSLPSKVIGQGSTSSIKLKK